MTTGKIDEFDYKAHAEKTADQYRSFMDVTKMNVVDLPQPANPESACKQIECLAELLRLQQVVVEAAKRDRLATYEGSGSNRDIDAMIHTRTALHKAVDALLAFEANQK